MRKVIFVLIAVTISSFAMVGIPTGKKPDMQIGEILFSPVDENSMNGIEKFASEHNATITKVTRVLSIYLMKFPPVVSNSEIEKLFDGQNYRRFWNKYNKCRTQVFDMVKSLEKTALVRYAQPNYLYYIQYTPDDPYFVDDGMYGPDEGADQYASFIENVQEGWDYSLGSHDVLLCIIDSGVDVDHPDLSDNIWVNPGEDIDHDGELYDYDDLNGIDDDGDGYVDDLFGYDFVGGNSGNIFDPGDPAEEDWNPDIHYNGDDGWGEPDPSCGDGTFDMGVSHGTHCAGIAGAVIDNELDFAGGCGVVSIVPVRVMNAGGSGNSADLIAGVEYAAIIGADVASMSFGGMMGTIDTALVEACQYAYDNGVALIAASGNDGSEGVSSPASSPYTLAVGSFNSSLERSWFSNYGIGLDVLAGGGDATTDGWTTTYIEVIWSTWVRSVAEADSVGGGAAPGDHTIAGEAGTSMACPQAAGLAALIKSALPDISPDSVYNIIRNTAQDINTPGWDNETGYGIIDYGAAMGAIYHYTKTHFNRPENPYTISSCEDEYISGTINSLLDITEIEMEIDETPVSVSFIDDSFYCNDSLLHIEGEHQICITSIMSADSGEILPAPICRDFIIDLSPPYLTEIEPAPDTVCPSLSPNIVVTIEDEYSRPNTDSMFFTINGINYPPDSLDETNHRAIFKSGIHSLGWEDGDSISVCFSCQDIVDYCTPNAMDTCWSFTVRNSEIRAKTPKSFDISVYPNPTNPAGVIKLVLPRPDKISIGIFDMSGKLVSNIHNGWLDTGIHSYNIPKNLPSGEYTIRAIGDSFNKTTKIAIIR